MVDVGLFGFGYCACFVAEEEERNKKTSVCRCTNYHTSPPTLTPSTMEPVDSNIDLVRDESDPIRGPIKCLDLTEEILARFERNDPDLVGLTVQSKSWVQGAGSAFAQCKFLKRLVIQINTETQWVAELSAGIACNKTIEELELVFDRSEGGVLDIDAFRFLAPFFRNNSNIHSISITIYGYSPHSKLASLLEAIGASHNLTDLALHIDMDELGYTALANILQNPSCKVRTLDLKYSDICPKGMAILCNTLAKYNHTVRSLDLSEIDKRFATSHCFALSMILSHPLTSLKKLLLAESNVGDVGMSFLGDALAVNNVLQYIDLSFNPSITLKGWQAFSSCLRNPHSALKELDISGCNIDDQSVATVATSLAESSSVKTLDIASNVIGPAGVVTFFNIVLKGKSVLEELVLDSIEIHDITEGDICEFLRALCDESTIDSIYTSNHTFHTCEHLFDKMYPHPSPGVSDKICTLLDFNRNADKVEVARQKILDRHFYGGSTGINSLASLRETMLPHVIEWMGRDELGYAAMFEFVQRSPILFDISSVQATAGRKKRKK